MSKKQPMQPLVMDGDTVRFKENAVVRYLLDAGGIDMNALAVVPGFTKEDRAQFAQLIGYSVSGFQELSYVPGSVWSKARRKDEKARSKKANRESRETEGEKKP